MFVGGGEVEEICLACGQTQSGGPLDIEWCQDREMWIMFLLVSIPSGSQFTQPGHTCHSSSLVRGAELWEGGSWLMFLLDLLSLWPAGSL